MLIHLVCFKYKAEVAEEVRADHRAGLRALGTMDSVIALKVGADCVRSARSYDTGLSVTLADRAALDVYQRDLRHLPVAQLGASLCEHIVAVDFEE